MWRASRAALLAVLLLGGVLLADAVSPKDDDAFIGWQGESYKPMNPRTKVRSCLTPCVCVWR